MKTFVSALIVSIALVAATAPSQAANSDHDAPAWVKHAFSQIGD